MTAVGITPANAPEASVTAGITADLDAAGLTLAELHIDRAYLASDLVRERGPGLVIYCKAWRVRNIGGRFAKGQFTLDFAGRAADLPGRGKHAVRAGRDRALPEGHLRGLPAAAALHDQQQRAQRVHPSRRSTAGPAPRAPGHRRWPSAGYASASRSSTPWRMSATGKAAAPATAAPARTCSTSAASPSSTTSTSSPARGTDGDYQLAA